MPAYRGVDREALKNSITRAIARLRQWDVGDATKDMLDVWQESTPFTIFDEAEDDRILAAIMDVTGAKTLFTKLTNVFRYHAALGAKGEESPANQKIFKDLAAWGAFVPPNKPDESWAAVQDEANQYLLKRCLDRLKPEDCEPGSPAYEVFKKALDSVKEEDEDTPKWKVDTVKWLRESVPLYIFLHSVGQDKEIVKLLDHMPKINTFIIMTLYEMTGLPAEEKKIEINHPLRYYRAMAPYPGETPGEAVHGTFNEQARQRTHEVFMDGVMDEVIAALGPYFPVDNAVAKVTGRDVTDAGACAVFFLSTREAAQTVANTLPYKIFDANENQIVPSAQPSLPPPSLQQ